MDLKFLQQRLGGEISGHQLRCPGPGHSAEDRSLCVKPSHLNGDGFVVSSFSGDSWELCKDFVRTKCGLEPWRANGKSKPTLESKTPRESSATSDRAIIARYDYTDANGELLYQVLRFTPKDFRYRKPNANGWTWKLGDVQRVLYRLCDLIQHPDVTVFVTEGEKDADRVASLGLCATTVASGKWTDACVKALADRDVLILEDADETGRKKAIAAASALYGTARTIRIVRLPDLPEGGDVSDWLDADPGRGGKLAEVCFDAQLWAPETTSTKDEAPTETPPLVFIDLTAWEGQPVPERQWAVLDRVPDGEVTLLSGEGATGKSLILKQLAVATVTAKDWLGTMLEPGPVIYLTAEEKIDELHFRLHQILGHYSARFADLGDLHIKSMKGEDTVLAHPDRAGIIRPTTLFGQLFQAALAIKPRWVGLDPAANLFAGDENNRSHVQQFIALLTRIAVQGNTAVILVSHPSLTGINTGSGLSGSTAWHNSVRSRLFLKRAATEKGEEPDPNMRMLEVMKNNYGPPAEAITLRWKDGLFLPVAGMSSLERLAREQNVEETFLKLLDRSIEQGRNVSDKKTANTFAPSRFAAEPEAKTEHVTKKELADAMERLFRSGKIHLVSYGLPSKGWTRIERR